MSINLKTLLIDLIQGKLLSILCVDLFSSYSLTMDDAFPSSQSLANKWKDEDLDDDIKDNWDDEDEEEEVVIEEKPQPVKKKPFKERIKEKDEKRRQAEAELEALANKVRTPEEILADKLEQQRLQEESDLMLAKDTFGVGVPSGCLSDVELVTKANFEDFRKLLVDKLATAEKSPLYVGFLETLFRELCVGMEVDDLKRLSSSLSALYNEKIKAQKVTI